MKNELLEEQIEKFINEELGIADEVVKLTNLIEKQVYSLINQGVSEKIFNVKTELSDVDVDYVYKEFDDKNELLSWFNETRRFDGYSYNTNTIYLSLYSINGVFNNINLTDTIMHECNHYWECKNSGTSPYSDRYDAISKGVSNSNPCISELCNILYYCDKHEINSFVNGTYSTAIKKMKEYETYKEFISDNGVDDLYIMLKYARKTVEKLENENNVFYFLAKFWFVSNGILDCEVEEVGNFIIKIAENAYKYLLTRIGKAYALYTAKFKEHQEKIRDARMRLWLQKQGLANTKTKNGDV